MLICPPMVSLFLVRVFSLGIFMQYYFVLSGLLLLIRFTTYHPRFLNLQFIQKYRTIIVGTFEYLCTACFTLVTQLSIYNYFVTYLYLLSIHTMYLFQRRHKCLSITVSIFNCQFAKFNSN